MLGATLTGAHARPVSTPPNAQQLTKQGIRDWINGVELIKTCMKTHDTKTYVLNRGVRGSRQEG